MDSAFITSLRKQIAWPADLRSNPTLGNLHPSLQNQQHTSYIIESVRSYRYPDGTKWEVIERLAKEHTLLPDDKKYIRRVQEFTIPGDHRTHRFVLLMFKEQSELWLKARHLTMDTSFKRVSGALEFAVESLDPITKTSVILARALFDSQTAEAHEHVLEAIWEVVKEDTGEYPEFAYMNPEGRGILTISVDQHRGQGGGLGKHAHKLAQKREGFDKREKGRRLKDLAPMEHLARFALVCSLHFKRNILPLKGSVSSDVYNAMLSLSSAEPLQDWDGLIKTIRQGGSKARAWLKDKEDSKFAIPALYQPKSQMSPEVFRSGRTTTNGIEQQHRNINRLGINLSILGGVMHAMQYESQWLIERRRMLEDDIHRGYKATTHHDIAMRAIGRSARAGQRKVDAADEAIEAVQAKLSSIEKSISKERAVVDDLRKNRKPIPKRALQSLEALSAKWDKAASEIQKKAAEGSKGRLDDLQNPLDDFKWKDPIMEAVTASSSQVLLVQPPQPRLNAQPTHTPLPQSAVPNLPLPYPQSAAHDHAYYAQSRLTPGMPAVQLRPSLHHHHSLPSLQPHAHSQPFAPPPPAAPSLPQNGSFTDSRNSPFNAQSGPTFRNDPPASGIYASSSRYQATTPGATYHGNASMDGALLGGIGLRAPDSNPLRLDTGITSGSQTRTATTQHGNSYNAAVGSQRHWQLSAFPQPIPTIATTRAPHGSGPNAVASPSGVHRISLPKPTNLQTHPYARSSESQDRGAGIARVRSAVDYSEYQSGLQLSTSGPISQHQSVPATSSLQNEAAFQSGSIDQTTSWLSDWTGGRITTFGNQVQDTGIGVRRMVNELEGPGRLGGGQWTSSESFSSSGALPSSSHEDSHWTGYSNSTTLDAQRQNQQPAFGGALTAFDGGSSGLEMIASDVLWQPDWLTMTVPEQPARGTLQDVTGTGWEPDSNEQQSARYEHR